MEKVIGIKERDVIKVGEDVSHIDYFKIRPERLPNGGAVNG